MSGKVWITGLVVCMILQAGVMIGVIFVGMDGLHDSPIMAGVKITTAQTGGWLLAGFASFIARYHPMFQKKEPEAPHD